MIYLRSTRGETTPRLDVTAVTAKKSGSENPFFIQPRLRSLKKYFLLPQLGIDFLSRNNRNNRNSRSQT
jgi:hypothetical protein